MQVETLNLSELRKSATEGEEDYHAQAIDIHLIYTTFTPHLHLWRPRGMQRARMTTTPRQACCSHTL